MTETRSSCHTPRVSVKPAPVTPAPAATLVLLRDRVAGGIEILLIQRHRASRFAAGDHVFPGGKIELDDTPQDAGRWCVGLDADEAARVLGLPSGPRTALGYWVGGIREAFGEVGVLLATDDQGRPPPIDPGRLAAHRGRRQPGRRSAWR